MDAPCSYYSKMQNNRRGSVLYVATYDNVKIQKIREYLPTAEQIQQQIEIAEEEYKLTLQKKDSHEKA